MRAMTFDIKVFCSLGVHLLKTMFMFKKTASVLAIFLLLSAKSFGQQTLTSQQKAEQVEALINSGGIVEVRIIAAPLVKVYTKDWMTNFSMSNGFLKFKKNENIHTWDIGNAVLIEKNGDVVLVHLADRAE
jgi:hypothetical protein